MEKFWSKAITARNTTHNEDDVLACYFGVTN